MSCPQYRYQNISHPLHGILVDRLDVLSIGPKNQHGTRHIICVDGTEFDYVEHATATPAENYIWFRIPGNKPFFNMALIEEWDQLFKPV